MEDLIKKLEDIKTPDIEVPSHKQKLKMALFSSGYFREKGIMKLRKSLAFISIPVLAAIIFLIFTVVSKGPLDTALFEKDESELNAFSNSLAFFDKESALLNEIDQTFSDILDESPALSPELAVEFTSIEKEGAEIDYSDDLTIFNEDILRELDQVLGEISQ